MKRMMLALVAAVAFATTVGVSPVSPTVDARPWAGGPVRAALPPYRPYYSPYWRPYYYGGYYRPSFYGGYYRPYYGGYGYPYYTNYYYYW